MSGGVGAGIFAESWMVEEYFHLPESATVFQAEVLAILKAAELSLDRGLRNTKPYLLDKKGTDDNGIRKKRLVIDFRKLNEWVGIGKICYIYVDDVIIFSENETENVKHIDSVLKRLPDANMRVAREKNSVL
ncbi:hypothetical protein KR054_008597 [Drosophila jambulina]|nr:hypothetical protein KR054_008597 [Drosophila jambulina]